MIAVAAAAEWIAETVIGGIAIFIVVAAGVLVTEIIKHRGK